MKHAVTHVGTAVILATTLVLRGTTGFAETVFHKQSDIIDLVTTDHAGTVYLLFEDSNKKQKLELCTCHCGKKHRHNWKHARFRLVPSLNSASICLLSDGQFYKFPMPVFKNDGPVQCPHEHGNAMTYNEFECKDVSADEPALEVSYRSFEGESILKRYSGKDAVGGLYMRLNRLAEEMNIDTAPQFLNVFGDGDLMVTKGDIIELRTKVKSVISAFNLKTINASGANAPSAAGANSFTGTGVQGTATFDYTQNGGVFTVQVGGGEFSVPNDGNVFRTKWSRYTARRVYAHADLSKAIGGRPQFTVFPPSLGLAKTLDYSAKTRNVAIGEVVVFQNRAGKYLAVKIVGIKDKQSGASENSLTIQWKVL